MKKLIALICAAVLALTALPAAAGGNVEPLARTELLDLTGVTTPQSNASEGWSFDPAGNDGEPALTLNNYGSESAHSAPILVPANTTITVTGDNYVDNACMDEDCDIISGCYDGYLRLQGSGTLNLYALEHHGRGISVPTGGVPDELEFLYVNDITINIYSQTPTSSTAFYIREGIYANQGAEFHNAEINIHGGTKGIWLQGASSTPTIYLTEETCPQLIIDNTDINIDMSGNDNFWSYAMGLKVICGRIVVTGNSDVVIHAGTDSIYTSFSLTILGGSVEVISTFGPTELVNINNLVVDSGARSVYFTGTRFPMRAVLKLKTHGISYLGEGLDLVLGTFEDGDFATEPDPNNNDLPGLRILGGELPEGHTVNFYGFGDELIESVEVADGEAAEAPEVPQIVNNENGTYIFCGWDAEFDNVTEDMDVHAVYLLLGDMDFNARVEVVDALMALRCSMGLFEPTDQQFLVGNVNMNSSIEVVDALIIMRYAMGLITSLI